MKILFFTDHFTPEMSPPAAHIYDRCKIWVEQGHQVTVVTNVPNYPFGKTYKNYINKFRQVEILDGIRVVRVITYMAENKGTLKRILDYLSYTISAFINSLFMEKPDVVISSSPPLFTPIVGVAFSILRGVPHVFEIRDLWPAFIAATNGWDKAGWMYRTLECLELWLYKKSKRIITFSPTFTDDLVSRGVEVDKIDLVINGSDLNLFSPKDPDQALLDELGLNDQLVIGYIGTIGLAHDLKNAVRAAKLVEDKNITLLFVGAGGEKENVQTLANELEAKNVIFIGRQEKKSVPRWWSICDVGLVHLKGSEELAAAIPSKIFESMAMGKPVLFSGLPGAGSYIVNSHEAGVCVTANDPQSLAKAMIAMKTDKEQLAIYATNSLASAPEYSRVKQAEKTLASLTKVL